ncbi:helix-turn-helix domain-containing protein [Paenibacillus sp. GCM10012306]|uniref:AraC family transcriptional regulator n=1 Tax=Paenibacillus sp. GCM10012306 TaxID=3317342 RepID=UPI00361AA535
MNKELHENNRYQDNLFPFEMYTVTRFKCIPHGRGFNDLHWHEELQFTLVTSGRITIQINGNNYTLCSGDAIFINKGLLHVTTDISDDGEYVSFNFPEKLLCFFSDSRMEYNYVQPYTNSFVFPTVVLSKNVGWQADILNVLRNLKRIHNEARYFGWEYEVSNLLTCIWFKLISNVILQKDKLHNKTLIQQQERIQLLISYIHQNFSNNINLADIAKAANISLAECNRCFRKVVHTTPYNYLIEYRIKRSLDLLKSTNLTITDIATRVGFNHVNHFIQSFKRNQGVTPKEYRNSI